MKSLFRIRVLWICSLSLSNYAFAQWVHTNGPWRDSVTYSYVDDLAHIGQTLFAADYNAQGLYRSTDKGASWNLIHSGLSGWDLTTINSLFVTDSSLYVASNNGAFL